LANGKKVTATICPKTPAFGRGRVAFGDRHMVAVILFRARLKWNPDEADRAGRWVCPSTRRANPNGVRCPNEALRAKTNESAGSMLRARARMGDVAVAAVRR